MLRTKLLPGARNVALASSLLWYGLLSPVVAAPFYNKLLFLPNYPDRYVEREYQVESLQGVPKQDLSIPSSNGAKLHAWLFRHPNSKFVVVVSHGNASNISRRVGLADDLLQLGCSVLLYDYQGYGRSEGEPSPKNVCDDGLAAFDYLRNRLGYSGEDIIVYGESLGCAVACHTSALRPCGAVVLQSGFSSLRQIASEKFLIFKIYPSALFPKPALDNVPIVEGKHPPLLIVHGERDETIPVSHAHRLFDVASQPKRLLVLPNSGHYVAEEDHGQYMEALEQFLSKLDNEPAAEKAESITDHHRS